MYNTLSLPTYATYTSKNIPAGPSQDGVKST